MITQKQMISLLVINPTTEREIGFNSALTTLLKMEALEKPASKVIIDQQGQMHFEHDKLRKVIAPLYNCIASNVILGIIEAKQQNAKLAAVKQLKDATGIGLREAKDLMDAYWLM